MLQGFQDQPDLKKVKGLPSRVVAEMKERDFRTLPNHTQFQNVAISASPGGEIALVVRSKRAIAPLNTKRRVLEVRSRMCCRRLRRLTYSVF